MIHARHALAVDDERLTFHPEIWDKEITSDQTMKQVWFCGMHTDVGGGYEEQNLSDIPLHWMFHEAKENGLLIYPDHRVKLSPDPDGHMHNSRDSFFTKFYRRRVRSWNNETHGEPVVHQSVEKRKLNKQNIANPEYKPWILKMRYRVEREQD